MKERLSARYSSHGLLSEESRVRHTIISGGQAQVLLSETLTAVMG
jgi:hypothetical protein